MKDLKNMILSIFFKVFSVACIMCFSQSCLLSDYFTFNSNDKIELLTSDDPPEIINMVKKAQQIANIQWTPLDTIPNRVGTYPAGVTITGIPYSSVKELDKFVGIDVSFHTFMTAVHNPKSVLYTERINAHPYNGDNCGAYYGTVCSMAVNYALGIDLPYLSFMYADADDFEIVEPNNVNYIREGDVLWSTGHVVLVLDIKKDASEQIVRISILESGGNTSIKHFSLQDFCNRWDTDKWVGYRYKELHLNKSYEPNPFVLVEDEKPSTFMYNDALCVSRGDRACYKEGERVVINILSDKYKELELYKDNILFQKVTVSSYNDVVFDDLEHGIYKARLFSLGKTSDYTSFEVVETDVFTESMGDSCIVRFNSANGMPKYVKLCTISGGHRFLHELSKHEVDAGEVVVRGLAYDEYVKVYFQGKFGGVTNKPISAKEVI